MLRIPLCLRVASGASLASSARFAFSLNVGRATSLNRWLGACCIAGTAELELPACFVNFKVPYTAKVREPSQCVYEATMTHPAACDAQVLTQGDRVLTPHEAHLEL